MKVGKGILTQSVEASNVFTNLFPVRWIAHIVRHCADAIEADKELDRLELLPIRNQLFGKNRCVRVITQPNVTCLAAFAAGFYESRMFFDQKRFTTGEDDFSHSRKKALEVLPERGVAVPLEARSIDPLP